LQTKSEEPSKISSRVKLRQPKKNRKRKEPRRLFIKESEKSLPKDKIRNRRILDKCVGKRNKKIITLKRRDGTEEDNEEVDYDAGEKTMKRIREEVDYDMEKNNADDENFEEIDKSGFLELFKEMGKMAKNTKPIANGIGEGIGIGIGTDIYNKAKFGSDENFKREFLALITGIRDEDFFRSEGGGTEDYNDIEENNDDDEEADEYNSEELENTVTEENNDEDRTNDQYVKHTPKHIQHIRYREESPSSNNEDAILRHSKGIRMQNYLPYENDDYRRSVPRANTQEYSDKGVNEIGGQYVNIYRE
jgi:hypothetical protein